MLKWCGREKKLAHEFTEKAAKNQRERLATASWVKGRQLAHYFRVKRGVVILEASLRKPSARLLLGSGCKRAETDSSRSSSGDGREQSWHRSLVSLTTAASEFVTEQPFLLKIGSAPASCRKRISGDAMNSQTAATIELWFFN